MELKDLLGDSYKEDMSVEEIATALKGVKVVDKAQFDNLSSEIADLKRQKKALETQGLSELEQYKQLTQDQEMNLVVANQKLAKISARNAFLESGIVESQFKPFLDLINTESEADAIKQAKSIASTLTTQKLEIEREVKKQVLQDTPKPDEVAGGQAPIVTKEQFNKMDHFQRSELKATNYELFKQLNTTE